MESATLPFRSVEALKEVRSTAGVVVTNDACVYRAMRRARCGLRAAVRNPSSLQQARHEALCVY
jgi:hypothetical protein